MQFPKAILQVLETSKHMRVALKLGLILIVASTALLLADRHRAADDCVERLARDRREHQEQVALALAPSVTLVWQREGETAARALVDEMQQHHPGMQLRTVDSAGHRRAGVLPSLEPAPNDERHPLQSRISKAGEDGPHLETFVSLPVNANRPRDLELRSPLPSASAPEQGGWPQRLGLLPWLFGSGALLSMAVGVHLVGRPLAQLSQQAQRLGRLDFAARNQHHARDEIGALALTMNHLAAHLAEARQRDSDETHAQVQALTKIHEQERAATVGRLAATVAHDLATPIMVARGRVAFLRDSCQEAGAREHAESVIKQLDRLAGTVSQMQEFARARLHAHRAFDLGPALQDVAQLVAPLARARGLRIDTVRPEHPLRVVADRPKLEHVLSSLLVSAIQSSDTGTIEIGCRPDSQHQVLVWVRDQGQSLSAHEREQLFQPMFSSGAATAGAALRLSVTRELIEEEGGQLDVESAPGQGNCVRFKLPVFALSPA